MPRKSARNSAKSTPEPKVSPRKSTRSSSRRKKSPPPVEVEIEPVEPQETVITNENCDKTVENEQTDNETNVDKATDETQTVTIKNELSNEGSHTPPHSGSADKEASDNDEVDAEKGKFKGINNSEIEENSEIKMNSVISVSVEEATNESTSEVIPQTNDDDNSQTPQNTDTDMAETAADIIADSQETKTSDTEDQKQDEAHDSEQTNGGHTTSEAVKTADEEQAEEGEITESKSDDEDKSEKPKEVKVKPPVKIKLRRDSFFESSEEPIPKKMNWNPEEHQCLKITLSDLHKLDIEYFKALSTDLKLATEEEIKLEETYKPKAIVERLTSRTSVDSEKIGDVAIEEEDTNIIALNRKISIVDDAASKLKPPPSPAKQPVSSVLFITNLVRPFTIKQLRELLERTGTIKEDGFWTDRIKSKCYVSYESVEEAESTRNALHGVHWPIGNGKKLIIDYATEEDMDKAKNPPVQPPPVPQPPPQVASPPKLPQKENENPIQQDMRNGEGREERKRKISEKEREKSRPAPTREWDIGKNSQKERSRSRSREQRRKHSRRSATPLEDFIARKQKKLEEAVPQKLMDDLFQRTRTMPCVYWQPLSPEEISIKQQQRLTRMEEHKRRLEENSRNRGQREPGRGAFRRRYD